MPKGAQRFFELGHRVSVANSRGPESLGGLARFGLRIRISMASSAFLCDSRSAVTACGVANKPGITCRQHERRRLKAHPAGFPYRRKAG